MNKQLFKYVGITLFAIILGVTAIIITVRGSGTLIKGESYKSVYYLAQDGKRYVFPNDKTFLSWYENFDTVTVVTDAELGSIPIGGNVTYRPGKKLVKIVTDPKTYAVDKTGTLRWITSEDVATALYGAEWETMVDDVPDEFFTNYKTGVPITNASEFNINIETTIDADKGIGGAGSVEEPPTVEIPPVQQPVIEPEPIIQPEVPMPVVKQELYFDKITFLSGTFDTEKRLLNVQINNGSLDGISWIEYNIVEVRADGTVHERILHTSSDIEAGGSGSFIVGPAFKDSLSFKISNIKILGTATGCLYTSEQVVEFLI